MAKRKRSVIDPNETADARFIRLATVRVSKALKAIRAVGALHGTRYTHTQAQVDKIVGALTAEVNSAKAALSSPSSSPKETFSF